jgi:hypothetical protein
MRQQFIDVITILKQHSQLENTAETRFQILDYKFVPRTPQRLISSSRERQSHSPSFSEIVFTYKLYLCPAVLSLLLPNGLEYVQYIKLPQIYRIRKLFGVLITHTKVSLETMT